MRIVNKKIRNQFFKSNLSIPTKFQCVFPLWLRKSILYIWIYILYIIYIKIDIFVWKPRYLSLLILFWLWHNWNQIFRKQNLLLLHTVRFYLSLCLTTLFIFFLSPFTPHHSLSLFLKSCLWPWLTNGLFLLMGYEL